MPIITSVALMIAVTELPAYRKHLALPRGRRLRVTTGARHHSETGEGVGFGFPITMLPRNRQGFVEPLRRLREVP